jgi:plastocyanin
MRAVLPAVVAASLLVCLTLAELIGQTPDSGVVSGTVKLTKRIRGAALPSNAYQPRAINRREPEAGPEIRNVVVYLKDAPYKGAIPVARRQIRQLHESFTPRVLAVTRGSTVEFPNDDPFFHNVFSLSGPANFDLGRFPHGTSRSRLFSKPGVVRVYCHIHSHMSATILVLDHPYFAIPELDGSFTIAGAPPGRFAIVGWHERVGERTAAVQVESGRTTSVNLALPVEDAS